MALRIDRQKEWEADEKGSVVIDGPNSTKGLLAAENLPLLFQTKVIIELPKSLLFYDMRLAE